MMGIFTSLLAASFFGAVAAPAAAIPERSDGAQIEHWTGGTTVAGAVRDQGRWWGSESEYRSGWSGSGEACYQGLRDGDRLIWRTPAWFARTFAADALAGDHLEVK